MLLSVERQHSQHAPATYSYDCSTETKTAQLYYERWTELSQTFWTNTSSNPLERTKHRKPHMLP
jgi:hypothetical protein